MKISKERRNQFFRRVVFPSPLDPHPFLATTGGNPPDSLSCRFPCHSARGSVLCLGNATVIPPGKTKHRSNCRYRGCCPYASGGKRRFSCRFISATGYGKFCQAYFTVPSASLQRNRSAIAVGEFIMLDMKEFHSGKPVL